MDYRVLLFYVYAGVGDASAVCAAHRRLCMGLGLRGRMLVAGEGINATLSGTEAAVEAYLLRYCGGGHPELGPSPLRSDVKIDACAGHPFGKLRIRLREEIVRSDMDVEVEQGLSATRGYLSPLDLHGLLGAAGSEATAGEDFLLVDVRNDYEYALGRFRGSLGLPIRYFRDFKVEALSLLAPHRKRRLITYCTGGIRCEKASAYLRAHGFEQVEQLHGGILAYAQQTDGRGFEGSCFVFDDRLRRAMPSPVGAQRVVVGRCHRCRQPTEEVTNCSLPSCHQLMLLCSSCSKQYAGTCSSACQMASTKA